MLVAQGFIGSPIAFKSQVITKLADGSVSIPSETTSFPDFDPNSVFRNPQLAGYWRVSLPGKAYAVALAVDSDGGVGRIHDNAVALADRVDAGGGSPLDRIERRRILTFYVRPAVLNGAPAAASSASRRR